MLVKGRWKLGMSLLDLSLDVKGGKKVVEE